MPEYYTKITEELNTRLNALRRHIPRTSSGCHDMRQIDTQIDTIEQRVLDKKTRALIALVIGVSTRCNDCIGFHAKALAHLAITEEEVTEALGMAVCMEGEPALIYAAQALFAFCEFLPARANTCDTST